METQCLLYITDIYVSFQLFVSNDQKQIFFLSRKTDNPKICSIEMWLFCVYVQIFNLQRRRGQISVLILFQFLLLFDFHMKLIFYVNLWFVNRTLHQHFHAILQRLWKAKTWSLTAKKHSATRNMWGKYIYNVLFL